MPVTIAALIFGSFWRAASEHRSRGRDPDWRRVRKRHEQQLLRALPTSEGRGSKLQGQL